MQFFYTEGLNQKGGTCYALSAKLTVAGRPFFWSGLPPFLGLCWSFRLAEPLNFAYFLKPDAAAVARRQPLPEGLTDGDSTDIATAAQGQESD